MKLKSVKVNLYAKRQECQHNLDFIITSNDVIMTAVKYLPTSFVYRSIGWVGEGTTSPISTLNTRLKRAIEDKLNHVHIPPVPDFEKFAFYAFIAMMGSLMIAAILSGRAG